MKYFLKSGCAAVVGLICALGIGQCSAVRADASGPYTITYKFTPGAVHKYSMTMDMTSQMATATTAKPMNIHFEMTEAQTIQSVRPSDGAATATVDMATTAALMNGQPLPATMLAKMAPPQITQVLLPNGQIVSTTIAGGQAAGSPMTDPNSFGTLSLLPSTPVSVGDSWTGSIPMTKIGLNVVCHMTLKSVQTVDGDSVAQIETTFTSSPTAPPTGQTPATADINTNMTGDTLTNFDIDSGTVKSSVGTMGMAMSPQANAEGAAAVPHFKMNMKMQMYLLP